MKYTLILLLFLVSNCRYYNVRQKIFINAVGDEKYLVQDAIDDINDSLGCNFIIYEDGVGLDKKADDLSVLNFEDEVKNYDDDNVLGMTYHYPTTSYDDITINRTRLYKETITYLDKKSVVQHEIGHLLGFEHENKWYSIMSSRLASRFWMSQQSIDEGWHDFIDEIKVSFPEMCKGN